jgi:pilus assembly protein Flp/PilA
VIPFLSREEGQGLIEYALIIVLVAIVVIAILLLLWDKIYDLLNQFLNFIS